MTGLNSKQLQALAAASGIAAFGGLLLYLTTWFSHDPRGFWVPYITAFRGTGLMALIFGAIWLVLTLAHRFTNFFDLDHKLDAEIFTISLIAISVAVLLLLFIVVPRIPATPPSQLPSKPKSRSEIVRTERNFRLLIAAAIVISGAAVASVPCRRFLRR